MHFFLTEILARIVAAYLAYDSFRKLRRGFSERKISIFNPDLLDWFSYAPADRDASPIRYWLEIGIQCVILISCVVVAIFGWLQPNS